MRAGRGVYVRPVTSRFGVRPPAPEKIVEALAGLKGETVAPSGASAANALGLTTQVPARMVYLTTGPARLLKVGRQEVELRHAPAWQLRWPRERAGQVVRALAWLGPEEAPQHVPALRKKLSPPERKQLAAATAGVPSWLAAHLSALAYG